MGSEFIFEEDIKSFEEILYRVSILQDNDYEEVNE